MTNESTASFETRSAPCAPHRNAPKRGQVLSSVNGRPDIVVDPYRYDRGGCFSRDWKSFSLALDPAWLLPGVNPFEWTVGPRPGCAYGDDDGYSVKFLQVQLDR